MLPVDSKMPRLRCMERLRPHPAAEPPQAGCCVPGSRAPSFPPSAGAGSHHCGSWTSAPRCRHVAEHASPADDRYGKQFHLAEDKLCFHRFSSTAVCKGVNSVCGSLAKSGELPSVPKEGLRKAQGGSRIKLYTRQYL